MRKRVYEFVYEYGDTGMQCGSQCYGVICKKNKENQNNSFTIATKINKQKNKKRHKIKREKEKKCL